MAASYLSLLHRLPRGTRCQLRPILCHYSPQTATAEQFSPYLQRYALPEATRCHVDYFSIGLRALEGWFGPSLRGPVPGQWRDVTCAPKRLEMVGARVAIRVGLAWCAPHLRVGAVDFALALVLLARSSSFLPGLSALTDSIFQASLVPYQHFQGFCAVCSLPALCRRPRCVSQRFALLCIRRTFAYGSAALLVQGLNVADHSIAVLTAARRRFSASKSAASGARTCSEAKPFRLELGGSWVGIGAYVVARLRSRRCVLPDTSELSPAASGVLPSGGAAARRSRRVSLALPPADLRCFTRGRYCHRPPTNVYVCLH